MITMLCSLHDNMTVLKKTPVAYSGTGNSQIPLGRRTQGDTPRGKYLAVIIERVTHTLNISNQETVLPAMKGKFMGEVADHVVHNGLYPKGVWSVPDSHLFSLKKGQPIPVFQSGVGLKASFYKKTDMKNCLSHSLKDTSNDFYPCGP